MNTICMYVNIYRYILIFFDAVDMFVLILIQFVWCRKCFLFALMDGLWFIVAVQVAQQSSLYSFGQLSRRSAQKKSTGHGQISGSRWTFCRKMIGKHGNKPIPSHGWEPFFSWKNVAFMFIIYYAGAKSSKFTVTSSFRLGLYCNYIYIYSPHYPIISQWTEGYRVHGWYFNFSAYQVCHSHPGVFSSAQGTKKLVYHDDEVIYIYIVYILYIYCIYILYIYIVYILYIYILYIYIYCIYIVYILSI